MYKVFLISPTSPNELEVWLNKLHDQDGLVLVATDGSYYIFIQTKHSSWGTVPKTLKVSEAAEMKQTGEVEFAEQIRGWIANLPTVKPAGSKNADKRNYVHPPEDTILPPQYICMTCKTVIGPIWDDYENQCSCGEYEYEVWRVAPYNGD